MKPILLTAEPHAQLKEVLNNLLKDAEASGERRLTIVVPWENFPETAQMLLGYSIVKDIRIKDTWAGTITQVRLYKGKS